MTSPSSDLHILEDNDLNVIIYGNLNLSQHFLQVPQVYVLTFAQLSCFSLLRGSFPFLPQFLGEILFTQTTYVSLKNLEQVHEWKQPHNELEICPFLNLCLFLFIFIYCISLTTSYWLILPCETPHVIILFLSIASSVPFPDKLHSLLQENNLIILLWSYLLSCPILYHFIKIFS